MSDTHDDVAAVADFDGRPTWLPEKFKTEDDFAESYRNLERRLTEQAEEISALRRTASLPAGMTAQDVAALQAADPYANAVMHEVQQTEPVQAQARMAQATSQLDAMQILSEAAEQARQATDREFAQQMGMTPSPEQTILTVADQAVQLLAQSHPGFNSGTTTLIAEELEENPAMVAILDQAMATGDPALVSNALSGTLAAKNARQQQQNTEEQFRTMKVNAQSIVGTGSRPSIDSADRVEWERVIRAGRRDGGY